MNEKVPRGRLSDRRKVALIAAAVGLAALLAVVVAWWAVTSGMGVWVLVGLVVIIAIALVVAD